MPSCQPICILLQQQQQSSHLLQAKQTSWREGLVDFTIHGIVPPINLWVIKYLFTKSQRQHIQIKMKPIVENDGHM